MFRILTRQTKWHVGGYKSVSTWSTLATAFNSRNTEKLGFNQTRKETGLFGIPELQNAEGFSILKKHAMAQCDILIAEATSCERKRKIVEIFDELSDTLCKVADLAEFVRIAHPEEEMASAAEDACITISGVVEKLNTHSELYNALSHVVNKGDVQKTSAIDNHVTKLFIFDFEQSGIHLAGEEKNVPLN